MRAMVMWRGVRPTDDWVQAQLPAIFKVGGGRAQGEAGRGGKLYRGCQRALE